jgi:hypothetical protein
MMAKRKKQQKDTQAPVNASAADISATTGQAATRSMPEQGMSRPELPEHAQDQSPLGSGMPRDRIASRAYEIYLERGGGDGRDMDDWLEAERQLSGRGRGPGE